MERFGGIMLWIGLTLSIFLLNVKLQDLMQGALTEPANPGTVSGYLPSIMIICFTFVPSKFESLFTVLECNNIGTGRGNVHVPLLSALLWQTLVLGKGFYGFTLCFVKDLCVIPREATFSCSPSNFFVFEHLVQLYLIKLHRTSERQPFRSTIFV